MDKRILALMGAAIALSAAFFVYRKMYYKHEGVRYNIRPTANIRPADSILYSDNTPGATRWKWDFGDGEYSAAPSGAHTYLDAGSYRLALTVYGSFGAIRTEDTVHVIGGNIVKAPDAQGILGLESGATGSVVAFAAAAPAESYEWRVEGDAAMAGRTQKSANAAYTFTKPGSKTIVLTTKSPDAIVRKTIMVSDAAPVVAAAPKAVPTAAPRSMPMPPGPKPTPRPHPASGSTRPAGGLDDLGNGVELKK